MQRRLPNTKARTTDELHLRWVKLRASGFTSAQIGARFGVSQEAVRIATNRICKADKAEARFWGDDPGTVASSYWDGNVMAMRGAANLVGHYGKGRVAR